MEAVKECKHRWKTISKRLKHYECRLCGKDLELDLYCEDCAHCEEVECVETCYHSSDGIRSLGTYLGCSLKPKKNGGDEPIREGEFNGCDCPDYEERQKEDK